MSHPEISNATPWTFEPLISSDEEGRPLLVLIIKATFDIHNDADLVRAEQQDPVHFGGVFWSDSDQSSYRFEPEVAFAKTATDIVLVGHAHARHAWDNEVDVLFCLGTVCKTLRVFGNRYWNRTLGQVLITSAEKFETVPLNYEHAFGGWDRTAVPDHHDFERRNPVGRGFRAKQSRAAEMALPNVEDPRFLICAWSDRPAPAGVGFTSPNWQPRVALGGTYDRTWMETRMPLLPENFDRRFFSGASDGLVYPGFVRGDEPVLFENAGMAPRVTFDLPGLPPPACTVSFRRGAVVPVAANLDTVVVNTDERKLNLTWRGCTPLRTGMTDVTAIQISQRV